MDRWTDGQMDRWTDSLTYRQSVRQRKIQTGSKTIRHAEGQRVD